MQRSTETVRRWRSARPRRRRRRTAHFGAVARQRFEVVDAAPWPRCRVGRQTRGYAANTRLRREHVSRVGGDEDLVS